MMFKPAAYTFGRRLTTARLPTSVNPFGKINVVPQVKFGTSSMNFASKPVGTNESGADNRPLRREDFVHPDHVKMVLDKGTMFVFAESNDLKEVPIADSIKESGIVPPGYTIDFVVSPERIISVLNQIGIKTFGQLPEETYYEMRATINNPSNLSIIPTRAYEAKRQLSAQTDADSKE